MPTEIVLVRHGATEWSASGQHTGRTDLPLTDEGRVEAERLAARLRGRDFELVLTSPLRRARDTAVLCGLGDRAEVDDDLHEWDYGDYEGKTTAEIRQRDPGWTVARPGRLARHSCSPVVTRCSTASARACRPPRW